MLVGYARVSSRGQSLAVQKDRLAMCDELYEETASATRYDRPQLQACLNYVRRDDILIVTRLDRLARSTIHLCQIGQVLEKKQVQLRVLDQNIDTSDATGRLIFHLLGAIAQFETELRAERQLEGILKAKEMGVHFGRRKRLTPVQVATLQRQRAAGVRLKDLMAEYGLTKTSIYRYLGDRTVD